MYINRRQFERVLIVDENNRFDSNAGFQPAIDPPVGGIEVPDNTDKTDDSEATSGTSGAEENHNSGFDYSNLSTVFVNNGLNALLEALKALKSAGVIESIKVHTDADGKTTVSCDFDGITYEFTGVKGDNPVEDNNKPAEDKGETNGTEHSENTGGNSSTNNTGNTGSTSGTENTGNSNGTDNSGSTNGAENTNTAGNSGSTNGTGDTNPVKPQETPAKNAAETLRNPIADVAESIVSVCKEQINFHNDIKIGYSFDTNGNIQFPKGSDAEKVFNTILERLKSRINRYTPDALKEIGGEEVLKKLLQSAWAEASSGIYFNAKTNTGDFINKIMKNLDKVLEKVSTNQEYLDYYIKDCYQDQTLINNLPNISDTQINYSTPKKFDTGEMHLDDDKSDKKFQETMNKLLENIYNKYPDIDKEYLKQTFFKAQENALRYSDIPDGMNIKKASVFYYNTKQNTGTMKDLVNLVLYHFDKLFKADAKDKVFDARKEDAPDAAPVSSQSAERNNQIKSGAAGISDYVADVSESIVAVCKEAINNKEKIHTEFGMDSNGNIVFQEADTQKVFDTIFDRLKSRINRYASTALQELGGESVLKQLLQAAWITTYNDFNSSLSNNTRDFINKVMSNLEKMLNKLQTNPELMEVLTTRTSYADGTLTNGLKHYNTKTTHGNDETIIYQGEVTIYADASIHISNTNDDNDYQQTMTPLLERLINKYPSLSKDTVTQVFRNAQKKALEALQSNKCDCPYGTGNNSGRVEDSRKDWSGKDNRKKDDYKIHMDQLVQMTLYYFDKLIYVELLK